MLHLTCRPGAALPRSCGTSQSKQASPQQARILSQAAVPTSPPAASEPSTHGAIQTPAIIRAWNDAVTLATGDVWRPDLEPKVIKQDMLGDSPMARLRAYNDAVMKATGDVWRPNLVRVLPGRGLLGPADPPAVLRAYNDNIMRLTGDFWRPVPKQSPQMQVSSATRVIPVSIRFYVSNRREFSFNYFHQSFET